MLRIKKFEVSKYWMHTDQNLLESVYMLDTFGGHFGRGDEQFWRHARDLKRVLHSVTESDNAVLPIIVLHKNQRTLFLCELKNISYEKSDNIFVRGDTPLEEKEGYDGKPTFTLDCIELYGDYEPQRGAK